MSRATLSDAQCDAIHFAALDVFDDDLNFSDLIATAVHEACHAELYVHHGIPFKSVSIIPEGDTLGRVVGCRVPVWAKHPAMRPCRMGPEKWNLLRGMDYWTKRMQISLAGQIGESIFLGGTTNPKSSQDDDRSRESVSWDFCETFEEMEAWHHWLSIKTRQHLSLPDVWYAVTTLADQLLEREVISYRLARDIIKRAYDSPEAKRLMEDYVSDYSVHHLTDVTEGY